MPPPRSTTALTVKLVSVVPARNRAAALPFASVVPGVRSSDAPVFAGESDHVIGLADTLRAPLHELSVSRSCDVEKPSAATDAGVAARLIPGQRSTRTSSP